MQTEAIIPIEHTIKDGVYTRIAYAKAGQLIVGCEHKKGGTAVLLKGTIRQIDGDQAYMVEAPFIINTDPGTQRIAFAETDAVYATMHSVVATTVEEAEKEVFVQVPQITRIRNSFNSLLLTLNVTDEEVKAEMDSQITLGEESDSYTIGNSAIHGLGCFAKRDIIRGECIAIAEIDGFRLPTARYVNHSDLPNAVFIDYKDSVSLVATKDIPLGYEILVNYKQRLIKCQE